jgi:DnaK suppressor protein
MSTLFAATPLLRTAAARLARRETELHALLRAAAGAALSGEHGVDVQDFKDVAAEETRAVVDEVAYAQAARELQQVFAARRRIADGSYGLCDDCGDPIADQRLAALPAAACCTACQAVHERPVLARR